MEILLSAFCLYKKTATINAVLLSMVKGVLGEFAPNKMDFVR